jgi:hypothetical protein
MIRSACSCFPRDFEHFVARHTRQQDCTGVICGHIHVPAIRELDGNAYDHGGAWVEHCTALVEHLDGTMELVSYDSVCLAAGGGRPRESAEALPSRPARSWKARARATHDRGFC